MSVFKIKNVLGAFSANYICDCLEECHLVSTIKSNMCHVAGYKNPAPFSQPVRNEGNIKHLTFAQWFYSAFRRLEVFAFLPD